MKFSILTFCLLLSSFIALVFCECVFYSAIHQADVILQKYERNRHIVESYDNLELITIPEGQSIEIYCDNGFSGSYKKFDLNNYYGNDDNTETFNNVKIIELDCKNEILEYVFDGKTIDSVNDIRCKNSFASLYPSTIPHCEKSGFLYGMNIKNQPIIFAEFCYDIRMSNLIFAHYVAGKRSPILEDQKQFHPSKIEINFNGLNKFTFLRTSRKNNGINRLPYDNNIQFSSIAGITEFQIDNLILLKNYSMIFEKFLKDKIEPNSVIWWSVLKNGNWKAFEKLFEKQTAENEYEIFAGKSGVITYPASEICDVTNELVLQVNGNKIFVPLYIWHYLKPRNNNKSIDEEVVVIGVNSPFFEILSSEKQDNINSTMICKDMCDDISWLKPLRKTRKMAHFGYIFCCKPDEVKNVLDGFPDLNHVTPEEEIIINKSKLGPKNTKTLLSGEDGIDNNDNIESQL